MKNIFSKNITEFLTYIKEMRDEQRLVKKIKKAFENNEFTMFLQFIVANKTEKLVSAEALSRWVSSGEVVPPARYIKVMEKYGLISRLDYYMFELVCQKLSEWKGTTFEGLSLSCNFTRITISEKDFLSKIISIVDKYSFDRSRLVIEITEDSIENNLVDAKNNIIKVKELGFRIALDDLGSGYTSLANLCEYPIDVAKIDRAILLMTDERKGNKLFNAIIALAHKLNLTVVCEGVETEEQKALVFESDCDYIQGYYYYKPMPVSAIETLFAGF